MSQSGEYYIHRPYSIVLDLSDIDVSLFFEMSGTTAGKATAAFAQPEEVVASSSSKPSGIVRSVEEAKGRIGRNPDRRDLRKYPKFDVVRGNARKSVFGVDRLDRLPVAEVSAFWGRLLSAYHLDREDEGVIATFMDAVMFYHALNGGSVLQPRHGKFYVAGTEFEYSVILDILGNDNRRFFRSMADEVRAVCQAVIEGLNPDDDQSCENFNFLMEAAADRGMHRHPTLIADSASACTGLSIGERAAISKASTIAIGGTFNSADTTYAGANPVSLDKVDSTAGASVAHADGANASGRLDSR